MQVTADIRRSDLVFFNLYMLPRFKTNWVVFGVLMTAFFHMFLMSGDRSDARYIGIAALSSALIAALAGTVLSLLGLACAVFTASEKAGNLGAHVFTLRKDGFHEQTRVNEGLHRWQQICSIMASKRYLYVGINWYIFHVIPARAFKSRGEFDEFSRLAHELWTAGVKSP